MPSKTYSIITSKTDLVSKWSVTQSGSSYTYGSPSTASKSFTIDLSDIQEGSRLVSATFYAQCNKPVGDSYAKNGSSSIKLTNNAASGGKSASAWLSSMDGSKWGKLTIKYLHQGYGGTTSGTSTLTITSSSLVVEYEMPNSTGKLNKTSVDTGASIVLTITAANTSYTHDVAWIFGSHSTAGTVSNLKSTWTVPTDYLSEITNKTSAAAKVRLTTKDSKGNTIGNVQEYSFNITVPASVVPSGGTITTSAVGDTYVVQNKSTANLSISNVAAGTGSTIKSVVFSGWGGEVTATASGSTYTANTGNIATSGTFNIVATITDNRGRQTIVGNKQLKVYQYFAPKITAITAKRCLANGTLDDSGTYAIVTVNYRYASVANQNQISMANPGGAWYSKVTDSGYSRSSNSFRIGTTSTSGETKTVSNTSIILGVASDASSLIDTDGEYKVKVIILDSYNGQAEISTKIPTTSYVLHFKNGGKSVAVGQAATVNNSFTVNPSWAVNVGGANAAKFPLSLEHKGNIAANTNFNSITNYGMYSVTSDENAQTMINCPATTGGLLVVMSSFLAERSRTMQQSNCRLKQIYFCSHKNEIYFRTINSGNDGNDNPLATPTFSAWKKVLSDGDNLQASSITGTLLVTNGGTGQTSLAGVKTWLNSVENIKSGTSISYNKFISFPGIVTSSGTKIFITINLGRPILSSVSSVTVSGDGWLITSRKIVESDDPVSLSSLGYDSASMDKDAGIVRLTFTDNDGFPGSNNVPAMFVTGNSFKLTFT